MFDSFSSTTQNLDLEITGKFQSGGLRQKFKRKADYSMNLG